MIPGDLLSAFPHRQFHTLPGLLDSWAGLPNSYRNALRAMQGGSLYHFYDGLWYDPAERRTHDLSCERRTRYRLSQPDRVVYARPNHTCTCAQPHLTWHSALYWLLLLIPAAGLLIVVVVMATRWRWCGSTHGLGSDAGLRGVGEGGRRRGAVLMLVDHVVAADLAWRSVAMLRLQLVLHPLVAFLLRRLRLRHYGGWQLSHLLSVHLMSSLVLMLLP